MSLAENLKRIRKASGLSQGRLAEKAKVSQQLVSRLEAGTDLTTKKLPQLASALGVTVTDLDPAYDIDRVEVVATVPIPLAPAKADAFVPIITPGADLVGPRDFPIYAAAEGGQGHMIVTFEEIERVKRPAILEGVKNAYGLLVSGDSMKPAYRHGDMALVHPGLPPQRGEDVVLFDHPLTELEDGQAEAIIKHLVGWTNTEWQLEQYNPPREWSELKANWPTCHRVVGSYKRR